MILDPRNTKEQNKNAEQSSQEKADSTRFFIDAQVPFYLS